MLLLSNPCFLDQKSSIIIPNRCSITFTKKFHLYYFSKWQVSEMIIRHDNPSLNPHAEFPP